MMMILGGATRVSQPTPIKIFAVIFAATLKILRMYLDAQDMRGYMPSAHRYNEGALVRFLSKILQLELNKISSKKATAVYSLFQFR